MSINGGNLSHLIAGLISPRWRTSHPKWNTYGDPPNSDLLRRYGHVDLVPLPDEPGVLGNPADVVEIKADLALQVCSDVGTDLSSENAKERIDWWLEEGGDE